MLEWVIAIGGGKDGSEIDEICISGVFPCFCCGIDFVEEVIEEVL